jgi:tetratricopeptide (TPR) repeat protein
MLQRPAPPAAAPGSKLMRTPAAIAPPRCAVVESGFVTPSQAVQERDLQVAMASPLTPPQSPDLDPQFLAQRGLGILAEGRRNKDALKDFNEAIELDPQLSIAYYGRGSYYISQERYDDALAELDEAIALNPLDAMAWFSRGEVHRMQKSFPEALRDMDEAIRLDSSHETAFRGRAEVHCAQGHYAEAISDLQEALEVEPSLHELVEHRIEDIELQIKDEQVKNLIESGVAYMQQGQDEDALADFIEATRIDPECAEAFSSLGTITHKLGRLDEALSYHERAREIEPKYASRIAYSAAYCSAAAAAAATAVGPTRTATRPPIAVAAEHERHARLSAYAVLAQIRWSILWPGAGFPLARQVPGGPNGLPDSSAHPPRHALAD